MSVYRFELRRTIGSAASWTAVLLALLIGLMRAVYPVFSASRADVEQVLAGFPPEFAAAFGVSMDDMFSYGGFYAFGALYLTLLGTIMASVLGIAIFAREKRAKCTDFLLTKPMTRGALFRQKLLAALTPLFLANVLYAIATLWLYRAAGGTRVPVGNVLLASSALLLTQILMLSVAVTAAVRFRRVRSVSGLAMAIAFGAFVLSALQSILKEEALRFVTPYRYFDVTTAFFDGRFEARYALTAALVIAALMAVSYAVYCRRDAAAA